MFSVGENVKVVRIQKGVTGMKPFLNTIQTISEVFQDGSYKLVDSNYYWLEKWLEPYTTIEDIEESELISMFK